jgi:hypothetical protein
MVKSDNYVPPITKLFSASGYFFSPEIEIFSSVPCCQIPPIYSLYLGRKTRFGTNKNRKENYRFLSLNFLIEPEDEGFLTRYKRS